MGQETVWGVEDDGSGGPWAEVHYQNNRKDQRNGVEMTFIVQNLPDQTTKMTLWRAFQPYDCLSDAYVARKKDKRGNHFGSVRYVGIENLNTTLAEMNSVKIFEAKVSVALAKYDKNHKKFIYTSKFVGEKIWRPKDAVNSNQQNSGPSFRGAEVREGQSFASLFQKGSHVPNLGAKTITISNKRSKYPLHCMGRSIHGVVKDVSSLDNLNLQLSNAGMEDYWLSYIGGLSVLLTLGNPGLVEEAMANHSGFLANVFNHFYVWKGEDLLLDRVVSLRITGIPVHLRDSSLYDQIGGLFGRVVEESSFSWLGSHNSDGTVLVLVPPGKRIEESVVINWQERRFVVWVSEDVNVWKPVLDGDFQTGDEGESPDDSSDEVSSDGEHDWEDDDQMADDFEEGEIRQPENDQPIPDWNKVSPVKKAPESGSVIAPEFERMEDGRLNTKGEAIRFSIRESQALHGENSTHGNYNYNVGPEALLEKKTAVEPQSLEERENFLVDQLCQDGPTPQTGLGKRPGAFRSPPSSDSMQGPPSRNFKHNLEPGGTSFDLNSPTVNIGDTNYASGDVESHKLEELNLEREDGAPQQPPDKQFDSGETTIPDPGVPGPSIEEEVHITAVVGSKVGINLSGFEEAAKALIQGEGVQSCLQ
ncbi:putative RNA recognition motif domain, nucleotide-binding alpha-beta plait domain superfamily [Helianthus annuus]|nr:putative RNA recognition motif domain, nucleotide-binding alpha-beta plait domain superfamily [Helianthus annuus]